jgi:hypothetical protein
LEADVRRLAHACDEGKADYMEPWYFHLRPEASPPDLITGPYRIVIVADQVVSDDWLNRIAEWIVAVGSLYVVAWGVECEKWHDAVDWAVLTVFEFGDIPDDRFIMTTWHSDEPISEAFWFAGHCATHPDVELTETIILHIAGDAHSARLLRTFRDSQALADDA